MRMTTKRLLEKTFGFVVIGAFSAACSVTPAAVSGASDGTGGTRNGSSSASGGRSGTSAGGSSAPVIVLPNVGGTRGTDSTSSSPAADGGSSDGVCGSATASMEQKPADVLLLLDRSGSMACSMTDTMPGCFPYWDPSQRRWTILSAAVKKVLSASPASIHWGLKFFASPSNACGVDPGVSIEVGASTAGSIGSSIDGTLPDGDTPTRDAINTSKDYLSKLSENNSKYILLATDGEPNVCKDPKDPSNTTDDLSATTSAVGAAAAAGIKVYVIGVGPSVNNLNGLAKAGGTGQYYPAASADDLTKALQTITGQVASCTYSLGQVPPVPNKIGVFLDKSLIPQSDTQGWSYLSGNDSVKFNGSYCDDIKTGRYSKVEVLFGCQDTQIPSVIP